MTQSAQTVTAKCSKIYTQRSRTNMLLQCNTHCHVVPRIPRRLECASTDLLSKCQNVVIPSHITIPHSSVTDCQLLTPVLSTVTRLIHTAKYLQCLKIISSNMTSKWPICYTLQETDLDANFILIFSICPCNKQSLIISIESLDSLSFSGSACTFKISTMQTHGDHQMAC